ETYPISNAFLSDTHLSHENQPTPYPLTLSSLVLGYGARAHPLGLNLMFTHSVGHQSSGLGFSTSLSEEEWRRPTSNLGKMKYFFLQVTQKPSPNMRENI
ncbi:hypothetical protein H5410_002735, partial [Solanum commersonii]